MLKSMQNDYKHHTEVKDAQDDGKPVTFFWHWPRGTFDARMSAYEIAKFIIPHMPSILPFLGINSRAYHEFKLMTDKLILSPETEIDQMLPWIKTLVKTGEDDLIELCIGNKVITPRTQFISYRK